MVSLPLTHRSIYVAFGTYGMQLVALSIGVLRWSRRHYSAAGGLWFVIGLNAWLVWTSLIWWASVLSGWFASGAPAGHYLLSVTVGLVPLLAAIWILGVKLRNRA